MRWTWSSAAIVAGLAAAFHVLTFPPFGRTSLTWIALAPFFLVFPAPNRRAAATIGGAFGTIAAVGIVGPWLAPALATFFGLSAVASAAATLATSIVGGGVPLAILGVLLQRLSVFSPTSRLLLVPAAWVAVEYARGAVFGMPWAVLGAALAESSLPVQIADLGGVHAVSYVAALTSAAAAEAVTWALRRPRGRLPTTAIAVALAVVAAATLYGGLRRATVREAIAQAPIARVAIVHAELANERRQGPGVAAAALARYLELGPAPGTDVDLVVWPENAVNLLLEENPSLTERIAVRAGATRFLIGAPRMAAAADRAALRTAALVVGADGIEAAYDKRRLLPFAETLPSLRGGGTAVAREFTPGAGTSVLSIGDLRAGISICYEAIFPDLARAAVRGGAELLVNLSNDSWFPPGAGPAQHFLLARLRAVEERRALVRAANLGITAIVLPDGSTPLATDGVTPGLEVAPVPRMQMVTVYARVGDAFAWLCIAAVLLGLGLRWSPASSPQ